MIFEVMAVLLRVAETIDDSSGNGSILDGLTCLAFELLSEGKIGLDERCGVKEFLNVKKIRKKC